MKTTMGCVCIFLSLSFSFLTFRFLSSLFFSFSFFLFSASFCFSAFFFLIFPNKFNSCIWFSYLDLFCEFRDSETEIVLPMEHVPIKGHTDRSFAAARKSCVESNGHSKKKKDEFVLERNRSARYSPNNIDNGLLRFNLTPGMMGSNRRDGSGKNRASHALSIARSVLRLY